MAGKGTVTFMGWWQKIDRWHLMASAVLTETVFLPAPKEEVRVMSHVTNLKHIKRNLNSL